MSRDGSQHIPLMALRNVQVRRGGHTILDIPELAVWPGAVLAVVGPNGAGKSTLLQVMALLLAPEAGEVHFAGTHVDTRRNPVATRRRMAVVFQESLLFDASVFDNVASGLRLRGVGRSQTHDQVEAWLSRLGIAHLAARSARSLSGGEAQRTSLARALVLAPALLLLDEPFAALDYFTRQSLLAELPPLLEAAGTTTVLVTHDPREAHSLAARTIALRGGQIVADGPTATALSAAGFVGNRD